MIVVHLLSTLGWPSHIGTEKLDNQLAIDEGSVSSVTKSIPELELLLTEVTLVVVSKSFNFPSRFLLVQSILIPVTMLESSKHGY